MHDTNDTKKNLLGASLRATQMTQMRFYNNKKKRKKGLPSSGQPEGNIDDEGEKDEAVDEDESERVGRQRI